MRAGLAQPAGAMEDDDRLAGAGLFEPNAEAVRLDEAFFEHLYSSCIRGITLVPNSSSALRALSRPTGEKMTSRKPLLSSSLIDRICDSTLSGLPATSCPRSRRSFRSWA